MPKELKFGRDGGEVNPAFLEKALGLPPGSILRTRNEPNGDIIPIFADGVILPNPTLEAQLEKVLGSPRKA